MATNDAGDEFRWLRHVCAAPVLPLAYHLRWRSELTAAYTSPAIYGVAGGLSLLSTVALHAVLLTLLQRWVYDDLEIQLRQAATTKMARRDWKAASEDWSRILRLNPSDADGLKQRGQCFLHLGETDKATSDFARSLALHPADSILHEQLNILRPNQVPSSPPQHGVWSKVIAPFALLSVGSQSTWSTRVLVLLLLPILLACLLLHALVRGAVNVLISSLHLAWRSARALVRQTWRALQAIHALWLATVRVMATTVDAAVARTRAIVARVYTNLYQCVTEQIPDAVTYLRVSCLAFILSVLLCTERLVRYGADLLWRCIEVFRHRRRLPLGQVILTVAEAAYPVVDAGVDTVLTAYTRTGEAASHAIATARDLLFLHGLVATLAAISRASLLLHQAHGRLRRATRYLYMHGLVPGLAFLRLLLRQLRRSLWSARDRLGHFARVLYWGCIVPGAYLLRDVITRALQWSWTLLLAATRWLRTSFATYVLLPLEAAIVAAMHQAIEALVAIKHCIEAAIAYVQGLAVSAWYWATATVLCLVNTLVNRAQGTLAWLGNVSYHLCMHIVLPHLHSLAVATCTVVERSFAWLQQVLRQLYTLCCALVQTLAPPILHVYYCVVYHAVDIAATVLLATVYKLHACFLLTRDVTLRPLARAMQTAVCYVGRTVLEVLSVSARHLLRLYHGLATTVMAISHHASIGGRRLLLAFATTGLRVAARCLVACGRLWRGSHRCVVWLLDAVYRLYFVVRSLFQAYVVPLARATWQCLVATALCVWRAAKYISSAVWSGLVAAAVAMRAAYTYLRISDHAVAVYASMVALLAAVWAAMWAASVWTSAVIVAASQTGMAVVAAAWVVATSVVVQLAQVTSAMACQLIDVASAITSATVQVAYDVASEIQRLCALGAKVL
ncbi:hypothetical protein SPRG_14622 [Saprolegnia parasitica CBS 223.65]|uniref:Uncharacterized protein n=1 Tax=Saprolegnia parasitica (strain CBS 223.65) TaxID=695850 RepID=A0A067BPA1_SAPPC|nr:hypothetical protein SPRG_14622 [Saprolegnia parasitica CBS 223.65]KDO20083.1 hypothetical protein SPRG_14622 [Saprolegnia parasitica CBS 223.65]|eukprot:XP_012209186.1 hypothetical protein SPRG_14622 [Saprolegnia parasitica CBS 223.65]